MRIYKDANFLNGYSMSQPLASDEIKFERSVRLEDIINLPVDSDFGYFYRS